MPTTTRGISTTPHAPPAPATWPGCGSGSRRNGAPSRPSTPCSPRRRKSATSSRPGSGTRRASPAGSPISPSMRQAQVGNPEGGSNFTTVANQLAFLNYPELLANTQTSSFDPRDLAAGDTRSRRSSHARRPSRTSRAESHGSGVRHPQRRRRHAPAGARPTYRHRLMMPAPRLPQAGH